MQSLKDYMAGCAIFSQLDLVKAYHKIPIAEADVPKTATATSFDLFEFLFFMAFGLKKRGSGPSVTQRQYPNGDDSKSKEQHWEHVLALFSILATNGLSLNLDVYMYHVQFIVTAKSALVTAILLSHLLPGAVFSLPWPWTLPTTGQSALASPRLIQQKNSSKPS
jgi:hypothetical protein